MERREYEIKGYGIAVCEKYVCLTGTRLIICDKALNPVCEFSDMKTYAWADFIDENLLIARNAQAVYKIYDLSKKQCIGRYAACGKSYEAFGLPVLDRKNRLVYDTFYRGQFTKKEVTVFFVDTGTFRRVPFPHEGTLGSPVWIDKRGRYRSIWYTIVSQNGDRVLFPKIAVLEDDSFTFSSFREPLYLRICFLTEKFVLTQLDEWIRLDTEERIKLHIPKEKMGYFCAAIYSEKTDRLILGYSDGVCVMDLCTVNCLFFHPEYYVSDIKIIGNDLFVGTWEKTVVYKDFVSEILEKTPE